MSNSVDPYETAHYEPSHLDLCCLQKKPIIIACGSERVYTLLKLYRIYPKYSDIFTPFNSIESPSK